MNNNNNDTALKFTVLGARGSMPGEGRAFATYGGATSCYLIRYGNEEIYLDAGSGISGVKPADGVNVSILLTHMHLDHIIGLPFFSALAERGRKIDIYAKKRENLSPKDALDRMTQKPFWPLTVSEYPAATNFVTLPDEQRELNIGSVKILMTEGAHPGGSTIFRLTAGGKSIVYATDFEHTNEGATEKLVTFAKNCDLLLYDAQYTTGEYEKFRGYGHSTPEAGLYIAAAADAKNLLFVHHAPWRHDVALEKMERATKNINPASSFAKIGDEFVLEEYP